MVISPSFRSLPDFYGSKPFLFNNTATPHLYTLSLHDALPISSQPGAVNKGWSAAAPFPFSSRPSSARSGWCERRHAGHSLRSEEHTSELQSRLHLVCRLLLEKKKVPNPNSTRPIWKTKKSPCK